MEEVVGSIPTRSTIITSCNACRLHPAEISEAAKATDDIKDSRFTTHQLCSFRNDLIGCRLVSGLSLERG